MLGRDKAVLLVIDDLVAKVAQSKAQADLLHLSVEGLRRHITFVRTAGEAVPSIDFPFAIIGERCEACSVHMLAAACSLVFLGLDILDDVADGDRPAHW